MAWQDLQPDLAGLAPRLGLQLMTLLADAAIRGAVGPGRVMHRPLPGRVAIRV